jgi:DNA repair exonuclease SbcCD ATPase subunit
MDQARAAVETAQAARTKAIADHALQAGRLQALQKQRDAEDLASAENRLRDATSHHAALPVPERVVTDAEVAAARSVVANTKADLDTIERDIQRTHGALDQVGGAVVRDRLRDVAEALEAAERREREVEAEYEAWSLLLEQMNQADAAQVSNLGQVFAPAVAARFEALTQQRYQSVRLSAQLGTEGVVVGGAVRPTERISVGTREQLSTLYRLSMAECLSTSVVLDDQLVQSDETRMDWFRELLAEKARLFQIVVFTCRPDDYLATTAMAAGGVVVHKDTEGGFVRAIELGRAVHRR